jgi:ABC-type uncharacterized transport system permease subunit
VWLLQVRPCPQEHGRALTAAFPLVALLVLATPFTGLAVHLTAALLAALVAAYLVVSHRRNHAVSGK